MNNPDNISESLETFFGFKILKFFNVDPGSGMEKNSDPGLNPGSETLPWRVKRESKLAGFDFIQ
jgi:hypothetical protein